MVTSSYSSRYIPSTFEDLREVNHRLRGNASHVRLAVDTIPDKSMFVFEHLTGHLLNLAQKDLSLAAIKRILKDALTGLAELHDQDVVHTGIPVLFSRNTRSKLTLRRYKTRQCLHQLAESQ